MLFRKTVRATTIDQFETALARANRIVVEGDDHLLAYAASRAAGAPEPAMPGYEKGVTASRTRSALPEAEQAAKRSRSLRFVVAALVVVMVGAVTLWLVFRTAYPLTEAALPPAAESAPATAPAGGGNGGAAMPAHPASPGFGAPSAPTDADMNDVAAMPPPEMAPPSPPGEKTGAANEARAASWPLSGVVWPFVALVALVLMYLLARQAIAGGSNVKLEWKVTEKVSGRIVITKVRGA